MAREQHIGDCEACGASINWYLIHNGFNASCHAYCSHCGMTVLLSWYAPQLRKRDIYPGEITPDLEPLLARCSCGGRFVVGAKPRCPSCAHELSPLEASNYIEPALPATQKGWRWQAVWNGKSALYAIIINNRLVEDPFGTWP